jgi:hypothetical protein
MTENSHVGDLAINQKYVDKENEVLKLLEEDAISSQLYPFTVEMIKPGALLVYPLVGDNPDINRWGCHIIRDPKAGYTYRPENDMRGGVAAGLFHTLPDNLWKDSLKQPSGTPSKIAETEALPQTGS